MCLPGPSDGQGPWGGHQHGWISCPAYPAQVFKWVWAVLILLNALFGPRRTNGHAWMGPNRPQVNAKCDVVMKLSVFGTRTDTHTRQNLYILAMRAVTMKNIHRSHSFFTHLLYWKEPDWSTIEVSTHKRLFKKSLSKPISRLSTEEIIPITQQNKSKHSSVTRIYKEYKINLSLN